MEALGSIDEQVVPMFLEAAKSLLSELEPEVALALALAKITGHTQLRVSCGGGRWWWQLLPPSVGFGAAPVSAVRVSHAGRAHARGGVRAGAGHTQLQAEPGLHSKAFEVAVCEHELQFAWQPL